MREPMQGQPTAPASPPSAPVGDYPATASDAELVSRLETLAEERERDANDVPPRSVAGWEAGRDALAIREVCRRLRSRAAAPVGETVAIPESLAVDVLDEIEAAMQAGKAMGHGAWAILNRVWRLLQPNLRADAERFAAPVAEGD